MKELTPAERRALRARAHSLDPVVLIGGAGLTPAVLIEVDRALDAHELIKVRVAADRDERDAMLADICQRTGSAPVQHIGRILVLFRPGPTAPVSPASKKPEADPRPARRPAPVSVRAQAPRIPARTAGRPAGRPAAGPAARPPARPAGRRAPPSTRPSTRKPAKSGRYS